MCHKRVHGFAGLALLGLLVGVTWGQEPPGDVIVARRVAGELPLDPTSPLWLPAEAREVALSPQNRTKPEVSQAAIERVSVRALHNGTRVAFRLEWEDATRDVVVGMDSYSDAAALMFPGAAASGKKLPQAITMGNPENPVNIWFWRAAWQFPSPRERTYGSSDDFAGGELARNPVSLPRQGAAEALVAKGFGTATDHPSRGTPVAAEGAWREGRWTVVLEGPISGDDQQADLKAKAETPVAFALWNGSEAQRGARKVYSPAWFKVTLEKQ